MDFLRQWNTPIAALCLMLWVALTPVLIALAVGGAQHVCFGSALFDDEHGTHLASWLLSLSEIVGGLAAILFAVITFAVEFHVSRAGDDERLVRYYHAEAGYLPCAAIGIGSSAAFALLSIAIEIGCLVPDAIVYIWSAVLLLGALGIAIWQLASVTNAATTPFLELVRHPLKRELRRVIDEEKRVKARAVVFRRFLATERARYDPYHGVFQVAPVVSWGAAVRAKGFVTSFDPEALGRLLRHVGQAFPNWVIVFRHGPGDAPSGPTLMVHARVSSPANGPPGSLPSQPEEEISESQAEHVAKAEEILQKVFRFSADRRLTGFVEVVDRLTSSSKRAAERGDSGALDRSLELLNDVLSEWATLSSASEQDSMLAVDTILPMRVQASLAGTAAAAAVATGEVSELIEAFIVNLLYTGARTGASPVYYLGATLIESYYWGLTDSAAT